MALRALGRSPQGLVFPTYASVGCGLGAVMSDRRRLGHTPSLTEAARFVPMMKRTDRRVAVCRSCGVRTDGCRPLTARMSLWRPRRPKLARSPA